MPAQSEVGFSVKQLGVPVEGKFRKFDAQVALDPKKPEAGSVSFTIDIASATMGNPESDAELPKAPWFNTAKFPQATFQSSAIKALGAGKFEVAGKLAIKGASKDVVVPVALTQSGANSTAVWHAGDIEPSSRASLAPWPFLNRARMFPGEDRIWVWSAAALASTRSMIAPGSTR